MINSPFDLERARRETPGCIDVAHFNNAGAALMPQAVLDAVIAHVRFEAANGGYEAAVGADDAIERTYAEIAMLIGAAPDEVALVESATRAWDSAFSAISFERGDRILIGRNEYASNVIAMLQLARAKGVQLEIVPDDEERGGISTHALVRALDERVKLIAITHLASAGGAINPVIEIGRIARSCGALYLLDACQTVGHLPIDVRETGCDFLAATGRKYLRAPRGTGFLYVRRELAQQLEPAFLDLHGATLVSYEQYAVRAGARRFETFEGNVAGKIGLGIAAAYANAWGMRQLAQRIIAVARTTRTRLAETDAVTVIDRPTDSSGIIGFLVRGIEPTEVVTRLRAQRINLWEANRTPMDPQSGNLTAFVRASVHYYNSDDEIDRLCTALQHLAGKP